MSRWYVDTSAAAKLLIDETETRPLLDALTAEAPELVASPLLETELRRLVQRYDTIAQPDASRVLDSIDLYEVPPSVYREAGLLHGPDLRSLDALHVATALRLDVDAVVTYDRRMALCCDDVGVAVVAPGTHE